ncbi:hypothetical protein D3C81_616720 [compost metagenome]
MRDDGVADVQFANIGNGGDRLHVGVMQAVARIDLQATAHAEQHARLDALQLCQLLGALGVRVAPRVQFDHGCAQLGGGGDLLLVGIDEQADADALALQLLHRRLHFLEVAHHIQTPFRRHFRAFFRHQADVRRLDAAGKIDHLGRDSRFQVHAREQLRRDGDHVTILDVAAVFAQMQGDGVGARLLGQQGRADRVRILRAARIAQGGHVVDIDAQVDDGAGRLQKAHGDGIRKVP